EKDSRASQELESQEIVFEGEGSRPRFAYESGAWARANPIVCYLTEQHRQDDEAFLSLLSAIRRNTFDEEHLAHVEARKVGAAKAPAQAPKLFSHNADVDRINDETLATLPGTPRGFTMRAQGAPNIVAALKKSCLSPEALFLKVGAAVMFTKNNPKEGYVNGTLGTVVSFNPVNGYPAVKMRSGKTIEVEPQEWMVEENGRMKARINQLPLRLAWAITVHKSQGMSLDEAVMDLSDVFEYGQGYVALSRVRRLSGLYLIGYNKRTFEVHPEVLKRDEVFRAASDEAADAFDQIGADDLKVMQTNFIKAIGGHEPLARSARAGILPNARRQEIDKDTKAAGDLSAHSSRLDKLREKHPNAYRPWDSDQDEKLKDLFESGKTPAQISKELGRQSGSIRSRLIKLGLIEDVG
ncbi:MAG TPA: hypothetical protein VFA15_00690, partial [Nitrososphaera sp.]|nr:hypothetical protein [Nitrososphaera sp.]